MRGWWHSKLTLGEAPDEYRFIIQHLVANSDPLRPQASPPYFRSGDPVLKYDAPISIATSDIAAGEHVHTHDVRSAYTPTCSLETARQRSEAPLDACYCAAAREQMSDETSIDALGHLSFVQDWRIDRPSFRYELLD